MRSILIGLMMTATGFAAVAEDFVAGQHYIPVDPPQPTRDSSRVEVVEVFSYACPHCASFQPYVEAWMEKDPGNIDFQRLPAVFRPNWEPLARAYYVGEILNVLDDTHMTIFDAMHKEKRNLFNPDEIKAVFAEHGIDESTYDSTAKSFAVETRMRRGDQLVRRYGIQGTPSIIVNGKWRVSTRTAGGGYDKMLDVVSHLIEMESATIAPAVASEDAGR